MKKVLRKSQSGFAIIEVLVAVSILVIVLYTLVSVQVDYFRRFHEISNQTSALSGLRSIEEDIMKDEKFIAPQTNINGLDADSIADDALAKSFEAPTKIDIRCYSQQGFLEDSSDITCKNFYYQVSYYKMSVLDRRFPASSPFSSIPMARMNMRVRYYDVDDTDKSNPKRVERNLYLSRLVTNAISY